jgi:hypothetical protein
VPDPTSRSAPSVYSDLKRGERDVLDLYGPWFKHPITGKFVDARDLPKMTLGDTEASKLYQRYTDNHPTIHSNRFPAWSELTEDEKQKWRDVDHEKRPDSDERECQEWLVTRNDAACRSA